MQECALLVHSVRPEPVERKVFGGYGVGASSFELALALQQLGCITGSALDGGSSTALAFEGSLLSRPSDPAGERDVSEALLVEYFGVYVPAPSAGAPSSLRRCE